MLKISQLLAELIGTFIFLLVVLINKDPISIVIGLLAVIYAFGGISGGHFNPAISFIMFMNNKIDVVKLFSYIMAQLLGGSLALLWYNLNIAKY